MIKTYKTIEEIANYIAFELEKAVIKNKTISIALSGGNTPKSIFIHWSKHFSDKLFWHNIKYFWVDERCVPPTDKESNFGVAYNLFFKPLHILSKQISRIKGEEIPKIEAIRYNSILQKKIPLNNGIPEFDFIFLGIGEDGHTASIFPGNENLFNIDENCTNTINPYNLQQRITITGKVINNAKRVMIIVLGDTKKQIIEDLSTKKSIKRFPAMYVHPKNEKLEILTDITINKT